MTEDQVDEAAVTAQGQTHEAIAATLRRATATLRDAGIPFMLGGSVACWARGGPRSQNDLDLMLQPEHAERALTALVEVGMRAEHTPEEWLLKAWDDNVEIDLICTSLGLGDITAEMIEKAEEMSVLAIRMPVMGIEDVLTGKLLAISEQDLDFGAPLEIARGLRERVRWDNVRARTEHSPYARAFLVLLAELGVIETRSAVAMAHLSTETGTRGSQPRSGRVAVFGPLPLLTVTVEGRGDEEPEIHLHAGGQGVWIARMAAVLGADVTLCAALGGESGRVLRALLEGEGIELRVVTTDVANGAYVHDRRSGRRRAIAEVPAPRLSRHELDDLFGLAISTGLEAGVALLAGSAGASVLGGDFYRRLAADLSENGATVVADLSDDQLRGALAGGIDLVKIADDRMVEDGYAGGMDEEDLVTGLGRLRDAGARNALVSREGKPALARVDDKLLRLIPPCLEPLDSRGAGDSQSAAMAVALARGRSMRDAMQLGMAAGALNVTRRGLGSGEHAAIERLVDQVELTELPTRQAS